MVCCTRHYILYLDEILRAGIPLLYKKHGTGGAYFRRSPNDSTSVVTNFTLILWTSNGGFAGTYASSLDERFG